MHCLAVSLIIGLINRNPKVFINRHRLMHFEIILFGCARYSDSHIVFFREGKGLLLLLQRFLFEQLLI